MTVHATNHWKLGLFIVLGLSVGLGALAWLGASRLHRETITSYYFFDETVDGLEVGAPVKFRGVTIGGVTAIMAAPDRRHVEVESEIYVDALDRLGLGTDERPGSVGEAQGDFVPEDLRVQLVSSILTGITFIQSDFFDPEKHPVPSYPFEVPWNTVHSVPSTFKSFEKGLTEVFERLPEIMDRTRTLLAKLDASLEELDMSSISSEASETLRAARTTLETADDALASGKAAADQAEQWLASFDPEPLAQESTAMVAEAREAAEELRLFLERVNADEGPVIALIQRYEKIGEELERTFGEADLAGTASALRQVSYGVNGTATELALLTQELRRDLPQLRDTLKAVGRLADLLERDPGALLRGRSPTTSVPIDGR